MVSILLDFAAADDLQGFKNAVDSGLPVNGSGLWYGSRIGSRKMAYEERTPLMVAALYGSINVLRYILSRAEESDTNRIAGSDGVSALHLAVAGGSPCSPTAIQILLDASANPNLVSSNGLKPSDLIPKSPSSKKLKTLFGSEESDPVSPKSEGGFGGAPLPDINTGVYGSDDFRMYSFKIKPCSRAYTHDWTECPFAHPGENARRRDPVRHQYSCVPCPEFKKGSCRKGDDCEFAHGVFESWLHPAQYRTRLCKDEIGCSRKVCFFAHRKNELRPVFVSTGSALPGSMDPISPSLSPSSPKWGSTSPPTLQLPGGSRLRSSSSARDVDLEMELLKSQIAHQNQLNLNPTNLESMFGLVNALNSPNAMSQLNINQLRNSYPVHTRKLSPTEFDSSPKSVAAAMLNSRAAASAFAKRSHSFVDRGAGVTSPGYMNGSVNYAPNWGLSDGKVDWSVHGDDLSKMRRSASFGIRGGVNVNANGGQLGSVGFAGPRMDEPDVSWVSSLVKDVAPPCSPWVDQVCT